MKKANLRLMGSLCPRIKHRIQNTIGFYQWFLIPIIVLFVSCQALGQEVKVQQMPSAATVSTNDFKENSTLQKSDGDSPKTEQDTTFQEKITPLKIGDKIPDELWEMYFPVISTASEKEQYLSLGDFKDKLIILDFWATWCSPCVAMIPVMDSLQKEFKDEVQFLSVTYQKKEEVLPFLAKLERVKKQKYHLPVLASDDHLVNVFPHNQLPHYVWIEKGVVKSITGYKEVSAENIQASVNKEENKTLKAKVDGKKVLYDQSESLFFKNSNLSLIKNSTLTSYIDGLGVGFSQSFFKKNSDKLKRVTARNLTIPQLFQLAFTDGVKTLNWSRTILSVKDSSLIHNNSHGKEYEDWLAAGNGFCYELILPSHENNPFSIMKDDMRRYFPSYTASMERLKVKTLVLTKSSNSKVFESKYGESQSVVAEDGMFINNKSLTEVIHYLETFLNKTIVNETGFNGLVDLDIRANLKDIRSINNALKVYDLNLEEKERYIDFLVVKDANPVLN